MYKVLVAGAGGPASEGVIKSLQTDRSEIEVIGMGASQEDLVGSSAVRRYLVPFATDSTYFESLSRLLIHERPDYIHAQNDLEVLAVSRFRENLNDFGVRTFLPSPETIELCVNKYKTYERFKKNGIPVPQNVLLQSYADLEKAFVTLVDEQGRLWLRSNKVGGGGMGALPTSDIEFARKWIDHHDGWGNFLAAEILSSQTVTWLSIWNKGQLVVAQTRRRGGWVHGNRTLSGVTGVTKIGITDSVDLVDKIALQAIEAVDPNPHGIFGVDLTYDATGIPNPTEINIGRFFTTIRFFTEAGLNMPKIAFDIAVNGTHNYEGPKLNPLPSDLMWLRAMDQEPLLLSSKDFDERITKL